MRAAATRRRKVFAPAALAPAVFAMAALACLAGAIGSAPAGERAAGEKAAAPAPAEDERRAKEIYFRDNPWSPLRAFARYDFAPRLTDGPEPSVVIGSAPGAGIRLDEPGIAPRHMKMSVLPPAKVDGPWRFLVERLEPGATIRIAGEGWPAPAPPPAPAGTSGPGSAAASSAARTPAADETRVIDEDTVVETGSFALRPYVQSDAGIVIQFDRRRTEGASFVPPLWFPVDPAWVFRAALQRFEEPETLSILTSLGRRKEYQRVGWFEVEPPAGAAGTAGASEAAGAPPARLRIYAYRPLFYAQAEGSLTILFTDRTTGEESYATGRYLDLEPPQDGLYTLDFNRAYNPLCAYTHVYNCPIPPRENALPVAVRAGERIWPGRPHL